MSKAIRLTASQFRAIAVKYLEPWRPNSEYEIACKSITQRAGSLLDAVLRLEGHKFSTEMAILARTAMNLHWIFRYITSTRLTNGEWVFEDSPSPRQLRLCQKYLNWPWIGLARRNPNHALAAMKAKKVLNLYGFTEIDQVRNKDHWYTEKHLNNIRDLANAVDGLAEYEKTYGFLSGLEHSDHSASLFAEMSEPLLESLVLSDVILMYRTPLESTLKILKVVPPENFSRIVIQMDDEIKRLRNLAADKS
jgi:hypothetical protein